MHFSEIKHYQHRITKLLEAHLPASSEKLHHAMRYSTLNGGKRLRPLLVYGAGKTAHAALDKLDNAAMAVECIHTYSLIHDDLPAMDNDDFRRGKLSCHKQFDEATAILAGDALQSLAFEILAKNQDIAQITLLAKAIGAEGMDLGQSQDISHKNLPLSQENLYHLHCLKTGKLILASVQLGLLCSNYDTELFENLSQFAENFGLAFQLRDDYLDTEEENKAQLKKQADVFFNHAKKYLKIQSHCNVDLLEEIINYIHY